MTLLLGRETEVISMKAAMEMGYYLLVIVGSRIHFSFEYQDILYFHRFSLYKHIFAISQNNVQKPEVTMFFPGKLASRVIISKANRYVITTPFHKWIYKEFVLLILNVLLVNRITDWGLSFTALG